MSVQTPRERLLAKLRGVQQLHDGWKAFCPAHAERRKRHLTITEAADSKLLVHCHRGCATEDVVKALDLTMADLYPVEDHQERRKVSESSWSMPGPNGERLEHIRIDYDDGEKDFTWKREGRWGLNGLRTEEIPLYGLEEAARNHPNAIRALVVEGERCRDLAQQACPELPVLGTVTGAGTFNEKTKAATPRAHSVAVLKALREALPGLCQLALWPDADGERRDHLGRRHMDLTTERAQQVGLEALLLEWSEAPPKGDVADYLARHSAAELRHHLQAAPKPWPGPLPPRATKAERDADVDEEHDWDQLEVDAVALDARDGLPTVVVNNRDLRDISAQALEALAQTNQPPHLFSRSLRLTRVAIDESDQRPVIQPLDVHGLRGELTRSANYRTVSKDLHGKTRQSAVPPPMPLTQDIRTLGMYGADFPPLDSIIEAPALRPDGSLISEPGYDSHTRLYYEPAPGLAAPEISARPTRQQVMEAKTRIEDVLCDFPFVSQAARANAIGLLLTPVVRSAIPGSVPLALVSAPQQGTGKGLLSHVAAIVATGRPAAAMAARTNEDEWRKSITSLMRAGSSFVLIDNIDPDKRLESASLSAVLTAPSWSDRVLGVSEEGRWPVRATWVATGNNVTVSSDLVRRCYSVQLDAKSSRPWQRGGFRHQDLEGFVTEHRGELLGALLTLSRAWFAANCPAASTATLGSFGGWTKVIGGILAHAGIEGFLSDLAHLYENADEETPQWLAFLRCWRSAFGDRSVTVKDVVEALPDHRGGFREVLPADLAEALETHRGFKTRLGMALRKRVGVRYGDEQLHLEREQDNHAKQIRWRCLAGEPTAAPITVLPGLLDILESEEEEVVKETIGDVVAEASEREANTASPVSQQPNGQKPTSEDSLWEDEHQMLASLERQWFQDRPDLDDTDDAIDDAFIAAMGAAESLEEEASR